MVKRKAPRVYAPPAKRSKNEMTYSMVKGSIQRGLDYESAAEEGAKSKYRGLWHFNQPWKGPPRWAVPVEAPKGVKPPAADPVAGPTPGFEAREPYFIVRSIGSEVEAALLRDVATLWLKLHQPGCTPAKLRAVKWNLPVMELWKEESGALKPLQRVPPQAQAAAQKTIRSLTTQLLPRLPKRLLPVYTLRAMKDEKARHAADKRRLAEAEAARKAAATEAARKAAAAKAAEAAKAQAEARRKKEAAAAAERAALHKKAADAAQRKARAVRAAVRAGGRSTRVKP